FSSATSSCIAGGNVFISIGSSIASAAFGSSDASSCARANRFAGEPASLPSDSFASASRRASAFVAPWSSLIMPCCLRIVRNAHTSTNSTTAVRMPTMISSTVEPVLIVNAHASAMITPMMIRFLRLIPPSCGGAGDSLAGSAAPWDPAAGSLFFDLEATLEVVPHRVHPALVATVDDRPEQARPRDHPGQPGLLVGARVVGAPEAVAVVVVVALAQLQHGVK